MNTLIQQFVQELNISHGMESDQVDAMGEFSDYVDLLKVTRAFSFLVEVRFKKGKLNEGAPQKCSLTSSEGETIDWNLSEVVSITVPAYVSGNTRHYDLVGSVIVCNEMEGTCERLKFMKKLAFIVEEQNGVKAVKVSIGDESIE